MITYIWLHKHETNPSHNVGLNNLAPLVQALEAVTSPYASTSTLLHATGECKLCFYVLGIHLSTFSVESPSLHRAPNLYHLAGDIAKTLNS